MEEKIKFKSGFVSILGRTNVGKSSIINSLVGEKVAAIANKPQTTRTVIMACLLYTSRWHKKKFQNI